MHGRLVVSSPLLCPSPVPFDQAHQVDLLGDLLLNKNSPVQVEWLTSDIFPTQFRAHESYTVNITLYEFNLESGEYQENTVLEENVRNSGRASVSLLTVRTNQMSTVVPMALRVSTNIDGNITFGIWSFATFMYLDDVAKMSTNLRWACSKWYLAELEDVQSRTNHSKPCPAAEGHMRLPGSGFTEVREAAGAATSVHHKSFLNFFYQGATTCYRSVGVSSK